MATVSCLQLFVVALALGQAWSDGGFEPGKKYTYFYDARVATGVSDQEVKQFAGRGYTATITVQLDNGKLYFKGSDVKTVGFNKRIDNLYDKLDLQYDSKDPADVLNFIRNEFGKVFWADYEHGVIKAIHFQADTSLPAVNFKKAVASVFQTNFEPLRHDGHHNYKVKEYGSGGECQTLYKVAHTPPRAHPEYDVLNVTKVRFYDECTYHPHMFHSTVQGSRCVDCEEDHFKAVNQLGRTEYMIKGTKQKYTIERIDNSGVVTFSPFSTAGETIVSIVNQTFTLMKVEKGVDALPYPRGEKKFENLDFEFHNEEEDHIDLKKAHFYDRIYHYDDTTHVQEAEKYLQDINTNIEDFDKNPKTLYKLIKYFRKFSYDEFEQFFNKHVKFHSSDDHGDRTDDATVDEYDRRSYLFRVLPLVGTNPSILYLFHLIENNKMSMGAITIALAKFPFHVKEPSKELLAEVFDFKAPYSGAEDHAVLAFGTLIYKACVVDAFNPHPGHRAKTYVDEATCKQYIEKLYQQYKSKKETPQLASNYLRALVNTHHDEVFEKLVKIAHGEDHAAHMHRAIALFGLYHYIERYPEKVAAAVSPIFYDTHEDHQLRIYAFEALLFSAKVPEFMGSLATLMNTEYDDKVANYIYSTLATISNTTEPCMEEYRLHARQVLKFIPRRYKDIAAHGTYRLFTSYNPKFNYGRLTHFVWVPSNSSFIPRDIYLRQAINVLGYEFDVLEVGVVGVPMDEFHELFKKIIDQDGLTDQYGKEHAIKVPEWKGERHPESNLDVYVKHFDQYTRAGDILSKMEHYKQFLDFVADKVNLDELKEKIMGDGGKMNVRSNRFHYTEAEYVVPNEMGMPVVLSLKMPATYKLAGTVGLKADIKDDKPKSIKFDFDLKLGLAFKSYASMSVYSKAFSYYGYKLSTEAGIKLPLKGSLKWDSEKHEVETVYMPSTESYDVVHYHSAPYTFEKQGDSYSYLPVTYNEHATQRLYKFGHNFFGVGMKFNFTYDYHWNDYASYRTFFKSFFKKPSSYDDYFYLADKYYGATKNFLSYAVYNPTARPFHFTARFEPSSSNPTNKVKTLVRRLEKYTETSDEDHGFTEKTWHAEVVAKGPTERKFEVDFNLKYNYPYRSHRSVDFHYKRSAIPEYDRNAFEICYNSDAKVEELHALFTDRFHMQKPVEWNYKSKLFVGKDCKAGAKEISIVGKGEKSEEQKNINYDKLPHYRKCKQDFEKGFEYSEDCWKVWKDIGRMDQFTFDVHFKNVPAEVKGFAYRIYAWFRHTFYNNLEIDYTHGTNEENHIKVHANFSYYHPIVDVQIERPDHTVYYHNVFVPSVVPQYEPITVTEELYKRYNRRVFNYHQPMCILSGDYVRTLDHAQYKADIGTCYHVALADYESGNAVVYVADHDSVKNHKKVKVVLSEDEVKIAEEGGVLTVYIDGEKKDISEHPMKVHLKGMGAEDYFKVYKYYDGYVVKSKQHGLYVFFDGKNVYIQPHFVYRGHATGLCGLFDGNSHHEFVGPDGHEYDDAEHFAHSFAVQEGDCTH